MKKKAYKIRIVSPEVYKQVVPHKEHADDTFGFTRKNRGEIYVKKASSKKETMDRLSHEMEELWASKSPHSVEGVRYGFFSKIGDWAEKTFLPEKVKETIQDTPILGDIVSRGWLGAPLQQFTDEGKEAYAKGTGTSGILNDYVYPLVMSAVTGTPFAGALYGAGNADHTSDVPLEALKGYGLGSLGTMGAGALGYQGAAAGTTLPGFGEGGMFSNMTLPGFGEGGMFENATLPGFGEGGMFAGGGAGGTGAAGGGGYSPQAGDFSTINWGTGNTPTPGGNFGAGFGGGSGSTGGGLLDMLKKGGTGVLDLLKGGGEGESNPLLKLLPTAIAGMGAFGGSSPEAPAFPGTPVPQQYDTATQLYENMLGIPSSGENIPGLQSVISGTDQPLNAPNVAGQQQEAFQNYLNLQQEDTMRGLKTRAAKEGCLNSSMFANQEADIGRRYGVEGGLGLADINKWLTGFQSDTAGKLSGLGTQYAGLDQYNKLPQFQTEMGRYNTQTANQSAQMQNLMSELSKLINPDPWSQVLKQIGIG